MILSLFPHRLESPAAGGGSGRQQDPQHIMGVESCPQAEATMHTSGCGQPERGHHHNAQKETYEHQPRVSWSEGKRLGRNNQKHTTDETI